MTKADGTQGRLVDWSNSAKITELNLDKADLQCFYLAQEAFDASASALQLSSDNTYDAVSRRIKNVAAGINTTDAINKAQLDAAVLAPVAPLAASIGNTPAGNIAAVNVQAALNELDTEKAPLASPALTGTPTAPTAAADTNTTQLATTAYVMSSLRRKNAIINGDFPVWQRGTSFAGISSGTYAADRWVYNGSGAFQHTLSRSTDVPTAAQAGRLFNFSLLADCSVADAAVAATDVLAIEQRVEGYNWLPLAQRPVTLSFWVKATKTGTYCVALTNSAGDRSYVAEYTVNATNSWEQKTITITASPSAGGWDYTTGIGVTVRFVLMAGSNYQTTPNLWNAGNFFATANQVNACDNTANDFRITRVQLEAGSVATEFEQRTFNEEFALCQRYYFKTFPTAQAPVQNAGVAGGLSMTMVSTAANVNIVGRPLPVEMRANPTVVTYNNHNTNANFSQAFAGGQEVAPNVFATSKQVTMSNVDAGTLTVPNPYEIHFTASAEL
jgi:hypothetical protein